MLSIPPEWIGLYTYSALSSKRQGHDMPAPMFVKLLQLLREDPPIPNFSVSLRVRQYTAEEHQQYYNPNGTKKRKPPLQFRILGTDGPASLASSGILYVEPNVTRNSNNTSSSSMFNPSSISQDEDSVVSPMDYCLVSQKEMEALEASIHTSGEHPPTTSFDVTASPPAWICSYFHKIFGPQHSSEEVYDGATSRLITQMLQGNHIAQVAYGSKKSGKMTWLQDTYKFALQDLFNRLEDRKKRRHRDVPQRNGEKTDEGGTIITDVVRVTSADLRQGAFYCNLANTGQYNDTKLKLCSIPRGTQQQHEFVLRNFADPSKDMKSMVVRNLKEALDVLQRIDYNHRVNMTYVSEVNFRVTTLIRISVSETKTKIMKCCEDEQEVKQRETDQEEEVGDLLLVKLSASEEGIPAMHCLRRVLRSLNLDRAAAASTPSLPRAFLPYRNSPLTMVLRPYLRSHHFHFCLLVNPTDVENTHSTIMFGEEIAPEKEPYL